MDHAFWHDRWQRNDIGFHQPHAHDLLVRHWRELGVAPGAEVLVPLSGKSLDMVWLAEHGMRVLGVELSERAADDFFAERSRAAGTTHEGGFTVKRAGPWEIWCGDFFDLPAEATRRIGAVYDRAALVAMPRVEQEHYARKLAELMPSATPMLLVSLDYDPSEMGGPPFPLPRAHVHSLFQSQFHLTLLESRDGLVASENLRRRGLSRLEESVFLIRRR